MNPNMKRNKRINNNAAELLNLQHYYVLQALNTASN